MKTDWGRLRIGTLAVPRLGGNYRNGPDSTARPLIKMGNIARVGIDLNRIEYIPDTDSVDPVHRLNFGDVLFNTRNTLDLVGKVSIWRDELPTAYYNSNILRLELRPEYCGSSEYFGYALNSKESIEAIRALATGTTSVAAVYTRDLLKLSVPVPSKQEQRAIAEALGDVDRLISALHRLIAKKQAIKQGMTQQLLTGRTRLPGFAESWEHQRLGNVLGFQAGYPFRSAQFSKSALGPRLVRNRDLKSDDSVIYYLGEYHANYILRDGDVLVGMDGDFTQCIWRGGDALLNQRIGRLLCKHSDPIFMYYALQGPLKVLEGGTGATTVKHLSHGDVEAIEMALPNIDEQRAIGSVLADADADLCVVFRRLEKARATKRGMMQELLTGRTRLPVAEAAL